MLVRQILPTQLNKFVSFILLIFITGCSVKPEETVSIKLGTLSCTETLRNFTTGGSVKVTGNHVGSGQNAGLILQGPTLLPNFNDNDLNRQRCKPVLDFILESQKENLKFNLEERELEIRRLKAQVETEEAKSIDAKRRLMGDKIEIHNDY